MRCRLGEKKHRKCEAFAGQEFAACLVRGQQPHYWALCVWDDDKGNQKELFVNYKTGEVKKKPPFVPGYQWV